MNATTITSLEASEMNLALTEPFAIAKGAPAVAANLLVRVELADGTVGLGEAAPFTEVSGETQQGSLMAIASVRAWLVGQDARAYRPIASRLLQEVPSEAAARCAVEIAILDALTRHLQLPLWVFFGGAGTELSTDMTITAGTAADAARAASAVVARGLTTLKVKVGAHSPEEDAERLRAVHQAAPHATLLADANGGYTPPQAASFIGLLEQMKVPLALFEQPVDPEDWLELAHAPRPLPVLLCADESVRSARDVIRLLREDA